MRDGQSGQSSWSIWVKHPNQSQPNQATRPDGPPCRLVVISWTVIHIKWFDPLTSQRVMIAIKRLIFVISMWHMMMTQRPLPARNDDLARATGARFRWKTLGPLKSSLKGPLVSPVLQMHSFLIKGLFKGLFKRNTFFPSESSPWSSRRPCPSPSVVRDASVLTTNVGGRSRCGSRPPAF